jgi:hypothetical protein
MIETLEAAWQSLDATPSKTITHKASKLRQALPGS